MYSADAKMGYIKQKITGSPNLNVEMVLRLFNKTEPFEERFGKDMCQFNRNEVHEMLAGLNYNTYDSLRVELSYMKTYTDWCIKNGLKEGKANNYSIRQENLLGYIMKPSVPIVTRETVLEWCGKMPNAFERAITLGIFEGIKGVNYIELVNLEKGDVKTESNLIWIRSRNEDLAISPELKRFMLDAADTNVYQTYGKTDGELEFLPSNLIIKERMNVGSNTGELQKGRRVNRSLELALTNIGVKDVNASLIRNSGIIHMIKEESKKRNISCDEFLARKSFRNIVERRFRLTLERGKLMLKYGDILGE